MLRTSYAHVRTRGTLILEVALVAGLLGLLVSIEHMHLALVAQQSHVASVVATAPSSNPATEPDTTTPKETAIKKECPKGTVQNVGVVEKDEAAGIEVKQTPSAKKSDCVVRWCDLGGACYLISAQEGAATALACGGLNNPCAEQKIADVKDETGITFGSGVAKGIGATSFGKEYSGILTDAFGNGSLDPGFDPQSTGVSDETRLRELAGIIQQSPGKLDVGDVKLTSKELESVNQKLAYLGDEGNMQRLSDDMVGSGNTRQPTSPQDSGWSSLADRTKNDVRTGTFRAAENDSIELLEKQIQDLEAKQKAIDKEVGEVSAAISRADAGESPELLGRLRERHAELVEESKKVGVELNQLKTKDEEDRKIDAELKSPTKSIWTRLADRILPDTTKTQEGTDQNIGFLTPEEKQRQFVLDQAKGGLSASEDAYECHLDVNCYVGKGGKLSDFGRTAEYKAKEEALKSDLESKKAAYDAQEETYRAERTKEANDRARAEEESARSTREIASANRLEELKKEAQCIEEGYDSCSVWAKAKGYVFGKNTDQAKMDKKLHEIEQDIAAEEKVLASIQSSKPTSVETTVASKTETKPSEVTRGDGSGWTPERNTPTVGDVDERLQPDAITKANSAVASAESKLHDMLRGDYTDDQEQDAVRGNWEALNKRVTDLEAAIPGTTAGTKKQIEAALEKAKAERDEFATTYGGKEQLDAETAETKEKAAEVARRELADEARRLGQRTTQPPPANQPLANQPPARGGDDFWSRLMGGGNGMSGEDKARLEQACRSGNSQACTALAQGNQGPLGQLMQGLQKALGGGGQGGGSSANNAAAQACAQYPGTTLTNGTCACPTGQQWDGKTCGTNQACVQYPGTTLVNGTCACPSGQQWNGSACAAGSTAVTAELACAPSVQEKGQPVQVSWSCSEGSTSRADGFTTNGQASGTTQVTASSTPGIDPNNRVMRLGLVCAKEGVTQSKTCDVTVSSTFISMASTPSTAVDKGSTVKLAWIAGGMKSGEDECVLTSSTEETFTHQGNSGVITTHPIEEDTTFTLTCTTLADTEKSAQIQVKSK